MGSTLYDADYHAWATQQTALLRAGRLAEADIENIAAAYERAVDTASGETGMPPETFPAACPWPLERTIEMDFWPD